MAGARQVALDQVVDDRHRTGAHHGGASGSGEEFTGDVDTTTVARHADAPEGHAVEALVVGDDVVGDDAAGAATVVRDAAAGGVGEVADDEVVLDLVAEGPGEDADRAGTLDPTVLVDLVEFDHHVAVGEHGAHHVALPEADAAGVVALVARDAVVADPKVRGLLEHLDAAAGDRALQCQAVDARRKGRRVVEVGVAEHGDDGSFTPRLVRIAPEDLADLGVPVREAIRCRRVAVDHRAQTTALQADRLVEDRVLRVFPARGGDDDEVAARGLVDGRLDRGGERINAGVDRGDHADRVGRRRVIGEGDTDLGRLGVVTAGDRDAAGYRTGHARRELGMDAGIAPGGCDHGVHVEVDDRAVLRGEGHRADGRSEAEVALDGIGAANHLARRVRQAGEPHRIDEDGAGAVAEERTWEGYRCGFRGDRLDHRRPIRRVHVNDPGGAVDETGDRDDRGVRVQVGARVVMESPRRRGEGRVVIRIRNAVRRIVRVRHRRVVEHQREDVRGETAGHRHRSVDRRGHEGLVGAELIAVGAGDFAAGPVAEGDGQPSRGSLLAVDRAVGVELGRQVVQHEANDARALGHLGVDMEVRRGVLAVGEVDLLHVGERPDVAGAQRSQLAAGVGAIREEAEDARHLEEIGTAGLGKDRLQVVQVDGVVGGGADQFGHQHQRAGLVVVAEDDVEAFLGLDQVTLRGEGLHDVVAGREQTLGCVGDRGGGNPRIVERRTGVAGHAAGEVGNEGIAAIEETGANLIPGRVVVAADDRLAHDDGRVGLLGPLGVGIIPGVGPGDLESVTGIKLAVAVMIEVLRSRSRGAFAPRERIVVDVGRGRLSVTVEVVDDAVGVLVLIEGDLNAGNQGLPGIHRAFAGIEFRTGQLIAYEACDAAVFARRVVGLAPVDAVVLVEEQHHGLEEVVGRNGIVLGAAEIVAGVGVDDPAARVLGPIGEDLELGLRNTDAIGRIGPAVVGEDRSTIIDDRGQAGRLVAFKTGLGDEPLEEREDLLHRVVALGIRDGGHVDAAVAVAEVEGLAGDADFAGVAEAVLVLVVEDAAFVGTEPAEHRHIAEVRVGRAHVDGDGVEERIEGLVPARELVTARGHVGDGEVAGGRITGDHGEAVAGGTEGVDRVEAHHALTDRRPEDGLLVVRGAAEMIEAERTREAVATGADGGAPLGLDRVGEPEEDVVGTGAKAFGEYRRFVGLHPGVHSLGSFDGGGLVPVAGDARSGLGALPLGAGGRNELHAILAHGQVLDQGLAIGVGVDAAVAQPVNHRSAIDHLRLGAVEFVGCAEGVAEGVGQDRPAENILQHDHEPPEALLAGIRDVVDRRVVVEREDRDLRGGDRVDVQDHLDGALVDAHLAAAHLKPVGQHRNEIPERRIARHAGGACGAVAVGTDRGMALVDHQRRTVHTGGSRGGQRGVVLLDHPTELRHRDSGAVHHLEVETRRLGCLGDQAGDRQGECAPHPLPAPTFRFSHLHSFL